MGRQVHIWSWKTPVQSDLDHAPTERPLRRAHCQVSLELPSACWVHGETGVDDCGRERTSVSASPPNLVRRQQVDEAEARRRTSADGADASGPVTCSELHAGRLGRRSRQDHGAPSFERRQVRELSPQVVHFNKVLPLRLHTRGDFGILSGKKTRRVFGYSNTLKSRLSC